MTKRGYLAAVIGEIQACNSDPALCIETRLLVSVNRAHSEVHAQENVRLALELRELYPEVVVGVDLSGDPSAHTLTGHLDALRMAKHAGLPLTVHVAEITSQCDTELLVALQPDRLGHATFLVGVQCGVRSTLLRMREGECECESVTERERERECVYVCVCVCVCVCVKACGCSFPCLLYTCSLYHIVDLANK
jgi:Adenosine deaminase